MKFRTLLLLAALLPALLQAAAADITGTVLAKATGEPLDYASVTLEKAANHQFVNGVQTDANGAFRLTGVPDGKYLVKVTFVGTVPQGREVTITNGQSVNLPPISLAEDSKLLKEVVVTGVKGQMKFELDRKVFNVDSNIAAAGVSASELLESIPSVEVDQDGEVSLRGNSSVTVWINGKESGLTADNRAQILEQIPAETIEKIEVITNPSAKYSPEGTAGIINIVLRKDRRAGYFGSAELGTSTNGSSNANFNINLNYGRWEGYAGLGLRMRHSRGGSKSRRTYTGTDYFLNSDGESRNHGNNAFLRLGGTYHATDKDEVSLSGFGMFGHNWGRSITEYTSNLPSQWNINRNTRRDTHDMRGFHAEASYKHSFSDTHTLDFNLSYNNWGVPPNHNSYLQEQHWDNPADGEPADISKYEEQEMKIGNNGVEAKLDYMIHFNSKFKLEAGYNGNFSREDTPTTTWSGTSPDDMAINPALYNRFIYDNDINALYTTFGGKTGNFSFSAGVRAEAWQIRTRSLTYGQTEADVPMYKRNNFALFPSAFISYSLPHDNEIQINYTRRIRRPWGGMLNSFVNISDPTNISYGNPELAPQYSNSFELNYLKTWTYHMISLSAYMRQSSGVMNRISYLDSNVLYTTWANAGNQVNMGTEIVVKNQFFKILDLTTTLNLYNSHYSAWDLDFKNGDKTYNVSRGKQDSFSWDIRCMASVRLPWQLSFQCTGRYNARQITAQGAREPGWNVDMGLRKNLGNWSFSINCRDVFNSRKWHNSTIGPDYEQTNESWRNGGHQIRFTVKYSFGNMKNRRRGPDQQGEPMDGSGYSEGMGMGMGMD